MFFKKIASGKMLSLLLIGSLIFVFNIKPVAKGNTIYIRPDGGVYPPMSPIQRNGGHIYSGYGSKEAISVAASFDGRSSIYGDIIVFIGQEEGAGGRRLMYYNISSATLTDTQKYGFFPSIHRNIVAFPMSPNWIGLYDIYTGALTNVTYSWDLADFSVWSHNWPADPISIYDNIVAFYDSEGIWYFNRSQTPVVFNKIGSGGQGVYVYGNIIVYSEVGIIKYLNLTSGVLTDTRVVGIAPSMYCNKFITFHNPPTVKYYNLSSSRVVDTMAIGDWPSIHGRYIAFSTDETKVGVDLNNDGDIDDLVIRYYDILTGTVMNTTEVGECAEGYGNIISFATKEAMIGRDLNNDGDMDDIVVRFLNCALPPPMEWNKTYGVEGGDVAFSVVQTVDGGYALAGGGSGDFWLVKTDANGVMQWNQTYGGTKEDWAWSVVQTSDGGYAIAGFTSSFGAGFNDFWLIKLASEAVQDVTITNITLSKTVVGQGYSLNINVTAADQGDCTETFNVTVYADTTIIETKEVTLTSGNSTTITFRWSTSGFAKGNYTIKAVADIVSGEMNTADNTFINGWVFVAMVGDVDANGKVDMIDLWLVAKAFGSLPNHERWDPECDVNNDGKIDMLDLWLTAREFGKIDP